MGIINTLPLNLPPGIFGDITTVAAGLRWVDADKVRFRDAGQDQFALPETIGGWAKYYSSTFTGVPRTIEAWAQLDGTMNHAIGTHKKVELLQNGTKYDITPRRAVRTGTLGANPIATNSTTTVTITHASHGLAVGDVVWFSGAAVVDGVDLNTFSWEVATVPTANTYTITYLVAATGTTAAGGGAAVAYNYDSFPMTNNPFTTSSGSTSVSVDWTSHGLTAGDSVTFSGVSVFNGVDLNGSWEVTTAATNTFTITYTSNASSSGAGGGASCRAYANIAIGNATGASMRIVCFAKWGEDLLINPGPNGYIYLWDATLGPSKRARLLPKAPRCNWILVGKEDYQVNAYGTNSDNLAQVWSSVADLSIWTAASTNTAGDKRYVSGSKIVCAVASHGEIVVFTDTELYSQQLVGGEDVYSFTPKGKITIMGPLAAREHNGIVRWMGNGQFYEYAGEIRPIPCSLQRTVFKDINTTEARGIVCGVNAENNEFWWWYTKSSTAATYNDAYIKYNFHPRCDCWDPGTMARTAWIDREIIYYPLGLSPTGYLYQHEYGITADGEPLDAYITSGDIGMVDENGRQVIQYVSKISFDEVMDGNIDVYLRHRRYPKRTAQVKGPWRITDTTEKIRPRIRNKYWSIEFQTPRISYLELLTEDGLILTQEEGGSITTETEPRDRTEDLATYWRQGKVAADRQKCGIR